MKSRLPALLVLWFLAMSIPAAAQTSSAASAKAADEGGTPIARVIEAVSKKTGKKFLLDPKMHASFTLVGQDLSSLDYGGLLSILDLTGFTAVERGGYVRVIPEATVRQTALPVVSASEDRPGDEYVSTVIHLKSVPATQLVPILRPLLPQQGHLAALPCKNVLIMVDTFANVRRIEALIQSFDTGEPYRTEKCEIKPPARQN